MIHKEHVHVHAHIYIYIYILHVSTYICIYIYIVIRTCLYIFYLYAHMYMYQYIMCFISFRNLKGHRSEPRTTDTPRYLMLEACATAHCAKRRAGRQILQATVHASFFLSARDLSDDLVGRSTRTCGWVAKSSLRHEMKRRDTVVAGNLHAGQHSGASYVVQDFVHPQ